MRLFEDIRRVLASNPTDYQPLEELCQDIIQAHSAGRLRREAVSRLVAGNRFDYALQLLWQAESSIQIFRRRADLWSHLASLEGGAIQPVSLTPSVLELLELLGTEMEIRRVEVIIECQERVIVQADPRSLSRRLFGYFLGVFEIADSGGAVRVEVNKASNSDFRQVCLIPMPAPALVQSLPTTLILSLPIERELYARRPASKGKGVDCR